MYQYIVMFRVCMIAGGVDVSGQSYGKVVDWMDAHGEEISLWQAMLDRPNIWIDGALMLRPNMDKRKYWTTVHHSAE